MVDRAVRRARSRRVGRTVRAHPMGVHTVTVNGVCHTMWEVDDVSHLCGRIDDHAGWHLCACGELLHTGQHALSAEQMLWRSVDCPNPTCLSRAGRPCHTTTGAVMTGVHAERRSRAERTARTE